MKIQKQWFAHLYAPQESVAAGRHFTKAEGKPLRPKTKLRGKREDIWISEEQQHRLLSFRD